MGSYSGFNGLGFYTVSTVSGFPLQGAGYTWPAGSPALQPGGGNTLTQFTGLPISSSTPLGLQGLLVPGSAPEGMSPLQGSGGYFFPSATVNWNNPYSQLGNRYY